MRSPNRLAILALIGAVAFAMFAFTGCTDEKTVFVERVLFDDPPADAIGFLGYDNAAEKLTTCGNCHVGQQSRWEGTAHADAWNTLQDSGHSQAFCENCHTAGPLGNATEGDVGYAGAQEARYHDVQCESCHGPGLGHVQNPDATQPAASIHVSLDPLEGCAECHSGAHHPFVEDWAASAHGTSNENFVLGRAESDPAHYGECLDCHSGQGALEAWGIDASYAEMNASPMNHESITCAVCHDPHSNRNAGQLRFPIDVPSEDENLCMKCHHKRASPDIEAESFRGPHSPEGPLLLGEAGWWPPNFTPEIDRIVATHGTVGNPRLCAACHVAPLTVTDAATGDFVVSSTGHLFQAIPCKDDQGIPVGGDCASIDDRAFEGCAVSGCHLGGVEAAKSAYIAARDRIANLTNELNDLVDQVTQCDPSQTDRNDGIFTAAEGASFNAQLGELPGSSTHNPFLMEQLLVASINFIETVYDSCGLTSSMVSRELMFD